MWSEKRSSAGCYCGKDAPKFTDEDLKIRPGYAGGVLPVAPPNHLSMLHDYIEPSERAVACPNQDVTYGQMVLSLDRDAVVIQVPDFGDRFWVYQTSISGPTRSRRSARCTARSQASIFWLRLTGRAPCRMGSSRSSARQHAWGW